MKCYKILPSVKSRVTGSGITSIFFKVGGISDVTITKKNKKAGEFNNVQGDEEMDELKMGLVQLTFVLTRVK